MPTRDAVGFGILTALLLFVALNLQAGWVYAVDALLLGLAVAGWLSAYLGARPLILRRSMPAEVFEGERVPIVLTAFSGRARPFIEIRDAIDGLDAGRIFAPVLRPGTALGYAPTARRRGVHRVETAELHAVGITGLFRFRRPVAAPGTITVLPRFVPLHDFPLPGRAGLEQSASQRVARSGLDVAGVREFRDGDDPSRIHWRSTARRGSLVVREFEQETEPGAALLLDNRPHPGAAEAFEDLVRAAASIAHYISRRGQQVRLLTSRGREPLLEAGGWREILHALARVTTDGLLAPGELIAGLPRGTPVVLLTCVAASAAALGSRTALSAVIADAASYQTAESSGGPLLLEALGIPVRVLRRGEELRSCLDSRA